MGVLYTYLLYLFGKGVNHKTSFIIQDMRAIFLIVSAVYPLLFECRLMPQKDVALHLVNQMLSLP